MSPKSSSKDLYSNKQILSGRSVSTSLGPFDGRVAAHIFTNPNIHHICTTPNETYIPNPPYTSVHSLRIRADLRYGIHDHTLYPQPYITYYSHLGAIPRKPKDPDDPLSVMWWDPTPDSFVTGPRGILLDTGSLATVKVVVFQQMCTNIQTRLDTYRNSTERIPPPHVLDLGADIATSMSNALIRLTSLRMSYTQMRFTVTEFQRYYLELVALLDYMEVYQPRMRGWKPAATAVDERIGVFTIQERVVQEFHRAGLPVWYVRPWEGGPFSNNVLEVVPVTMPDVRTDDYDPPFPTVYQGLLGGREAVDAIHKFSRNWLSSKDPFRGPEINISIPDPSAGPSRRHHPPLTGKPKIEGRNKFHPLTTAFAPFSIPAWAHGLKDVDTSYTNLVENAKSSPHFGHYAFPDPGLIAGAKEEGKGAKLLATWLFCREAWLACIASRDNIALPQQAWRDILFLDLSEAPTLGSNKASARRAEALAKFKPESLAAFRLQPQYATGQAMFWNGTTFPTGQLPPLDIVRQVLWELYELNFTYELLSLDRRACLDLDTSDQRAVYEREYIVSRCFPLYTFKQPAYDLPTTNTGLASNSVKERLPYLLQLARLMSSWRGEKPGIFYLHNVTSVDNVSTEQATCLELAVTRFYCQTFYNYFGRAAQIPHRLYYTQ